MATERAGYKFPLALFLGIATFCLLMHYAAASCVAHWSLNNSGGLSDDCTLQFNLTNTGAASGAAGVFAEAYDFELMDSDYMNSSDIDLLHSWTWCFWWKPESVGVNQGIIAKYSGVDTATNYVISLASSNNSMRIFTTDGGILSFTYSNVSLSTGNWYHVCAWYNESEFTAGFWINDSRAGEGTSANNMVNNNAGTGIGVISTSVGSYADGLIDDIWSFNETLNSTTVHNLFTYGNTSGIITTAVTLTDCANLSTSNTLYNLNNSVNSSSTCLNITGSNVTLNCSNHEVLYAKNSFGYGVQVWNTGATIENCIFNQTNSSALLAGSHAIYVMNGSDYATVFNNTATTSCGDCSPMFVNGTSTDWCEHVNISSNYLSASSGAYASWLKRVNLSVYDQNIAYANSATSYALNLDAVKYSTVSNSLLNATGLDTTVNPYDDGGAVWSYGDTNVTLRNITANATNPAIFVYGSYNLTVENSTLQSTYTYAWSMDRNPGYTPLIPESLGMFLANSTLIAPMQDIFLNFNIPRGTVMHAVNNAFTRGDVTVTNATLYVENFYYANVTECANGTGLDSLNITLTPATGTNITAFTGATGMTNRTIVIDYSVINGSVTSQNNYTIGAYNTTVNQDTHVLNITAYTVDSFCLYWDYAPAVALNSPSNMYNYTCMAAPCTVNFSYTPTDEHGFSKAELWANFSGTWARNQTNSTAIVNNTANTFASVTLPIGTYFWNVNVTDDGAFHNATAPANYTFSIVNLTVSLCGSGATYPVLNFTFADEETQAALAADFYGTFWFRASAGNMSINSTLNVTLTDVYNVTICLSSPGAYYMDSFQVYEANTTGYDPRFYFLDNATLVSGTFSNITLYLENHSLAKLVQLVVDEVNSQPVKNAYVFFQRYYSGENAYRTVAMIKTDDFGLGDTYLRPNDVWFRIIITRNGAVLGSFSPQTIACDPGATTCSLYLSLAPSYYLEYINYYDQIAWACAFNASGTNATVCTYTDTSGLAQYARLQVWKAGMFTPTLVCDTNASTASGTLTCPIANMSGLYTWSFAVHFQGETTLETGSLEWGRMSALFGQEGLFLAFMIVLVTAAVGAFNPGVAIIMGGIGVVISYILGVFSIEFSAVVAIMVVSLALYIKMR